MRTEKQPPKPTSSVVWIGSPDAHHRRAVADSAHFDDSDDFLMAEDAYRYDFYVVMWMQRGVSAVDLIRLIRRRSGAGVVAVGAHDYEQLRVGLEAGADAVVDAAAPVDYLEAVISAVRRRAVTGPTSAVGLFWLLSDEHRRLEAPDGTAIALSLSDLAIMRRFADADGETVSRSNLTEALWGPEAPDMDGALHAALYRLRKRIENAGQPLWPIYAVAGVGYEFRAPLRRT